MFRKSLFVVLMVLVFVASPTLGSQDQDEGRPVELTKIGYLEFSRKLPKGSGGSFQITVWEKPLGEKPNRGKACTLREETEIVFLNSDIESLPRDLVHTLNGDRVFIFFRGTAYGDGREGSETFCNRLTIARMDDR